MMVRAKLLISIIKMLWGLKTPQQLEHIYLLLKEKSFKQYFINLSGIKTDKISIYLASHWILMIVSGKIFF